MTFKDFNILYHMHLIEPAENQEDEDADIDVLDENKIYKRIFVPNLDSLWLKLKPSKEIFFHDIINMISEGLNSLQSFERWSRHDEMTPYVSVLEEWDDLVGDDWEQPLSNYLNPQDWLDKQPQEEYSDKVKTILDQAFGATMNYLHQFNDYLMVKF